MTLPYLPDDCIYYILKYLQPYNSTLFNCLLVNRFWCKATVPLLYADPFPLICRGKTVILTLILCFNKTEILQLKNHKDINNIINDEQKPLFEYLKYLKRFDYYKIGDTFLHWLESNLSVFNELDYKDALPIFHQSILNQCNNIEQLEIPLFALCDWNVQTIKTITSNLANLNSLLIIPSKLFNLREADNRISPEFLKNIGNICLNLRKFGISIDLTPPNDIKENICTIIQKQNNLEVIKLSIHCQSFLNNIFLSLEFQKHSLVYIEFDYIDFSSSCTSFKNFISLCNLKWLKFYSCNDTSESLDKYEILKYASFKLKRLELINRFNSCQIISLTIKYLVMQELVLHSKLNIDIVKNLSTYCLNLITLDIVIDENVDLLMLPYFKNLRIRILIIRCRWGVGNMIFKNLANNLPINVKEVYFISRRKLSYFKEFLENCHNFLEIIGTNRPIVSLLKIILDYIERGSDNYLKCLGITKLDDELDDEESKLLNQIKSKGVKIVDFYVIYKPCKKDF